jgi:hypothetical protein
MVLPVILVDHDLLGWQFNRHPNIVVSEHFSAPYKTSILAKVLYPSWFLAEIIDWSPLHRGWSSVVSGFIEE